MLHPVGIKELGRFLWRTEWDPVLTGFRKINMVATVSRETDSRENLEEGLPEMKLGAGDGSGKRKKKQT